MRTSGARSTAQDPTAALRIATAFRLAYGKAGAGRGGETGAGGSTISRGGGEGAACFPSLRHECAGLARRPGSYDEGELGVRQHSQARVRQHSQAGQGPKLGSACFACLPVCVM